MNKLSIGFRVLRDGVEIDAVHYERAVIKVGKIPSAHLLLDDASVSRIHCIIETGPAPSIIDLGSRSGTRVNGVRINKASLRPGDRVDVGVFTLIVELTGEVPRIEMPPLAVSPDHSQPITLPIPLPEEVSLDDLGAGLPAPRPAAVQLHGVKLDDSDAEPPIDRQLATWLGMLTDDAKAFVEAARDRADLDDLLGALLVVVIDKLREQQAEPQIGELYVQAIECLGMLTSARPAPSLLIALTHGMPKGSEQERWRVNVCAAIARHPGCWPYLARVAELPGFSTAAAHAAVRAGRDTAPWLAHPFWKVRLAAARAIQDDVMRTGALASVWESFARSNVPVEGNPRDGHALRVPRARRAWREFDWRAAAKRVGIEIETLPELPALVAGLESPCADFRAWTIGAIDRRRDRGDLVELAIADELDAARAGAGWPRTEVDWAAWRAVIPELPVEAGARRAWLFADACRRGDLAGGAVAILAGPRPEPGAPHLALDGDDREAILDHERCELLAALIHLEAVGTQLQADADPVKTPALPDA